MLIGQSIMAPGVADPGAYYVGAWMPRQGGSFAAVIEILKASAASGWRLDVTVQTKNAEDADPAVSAAGLGTLQMTSAITNRIRVTGCLELVRLVFNARTAGGPERWIHFRANPPIWEPN